MKMCQKTVLDAMDSFSDKAGNLMEEVYLYMTQKYYMYLFGCMEVCCFFATVSLCFVVVLMLHY